MTALQIVSRVQGTGEGHCVLKSLLLRDVSADKCQELFLVTVIEGDKAKDHPVGSCNGEQKWGCGLVYL